MQSYSAAKMTRAYRIESALVTIRTQATIFSFSAYTLQNIFILIINTFY